MTAPDVGWNCRPRRSFELENRNCPRLIHTLVSPWNNNASQALQPMARGEECPLPMQNIGIRSAHERRSRRCAPARSNMSFSISSRAPLAIFAALWLENGLHSTPYPATTVAIVSTSQRLLSERSAEWRTSKVPQVRDTACCTWQSRTADVTQ